jgi:hypothetical protein
MEIVDVIDEFPQLIEAPLVFVANATTAKSEGRAISCDHIWVGGPDRVQHVVSLRHGLVRLVQQLGEMRTRLGGIVVAALRRRGMQGAICLLGVVVDVAPGAPSSSSLRSSPNSLTTITPITVSRRAAVIATQPTRMAM